MMLFRQTLERQSHWRRLCKVSLTVLGGRYAPDAAEGEGVGARCTLGRSDITKPTRREAWMVGKAHQFICTKFQPPLQSLLHAHCP